jgi:2-keto-3-deoxy-L-rhamnonate aldolase RhmA
VLLCALLEDVAVLDNLDAILSVQGIDPVDLPRFSGEALGHSATVFSNSAGLVKSRAGL